MLEKIHLGIHGTGKTHTIRQKPIYATFEIYNNEDIKHTLSALQSYSPKRRVVLDIWANRKLKLYEYYNIMQSLPCQIVLEVRDNKHLEGFLAQNIQNHKPPTPQEIAVFLAQGGVPKDRLQDATKMCANWHHATIEAHRAKKEGYVPIPNFFREKNLAMITKHDIGLNYITYERTIGKKVFGGVVGDIISSSSSDRCKLCGGFRGAHNNALHPFGGEMI